MRSTKIVGRKHRTRYVSSVATAHGEMGARTCVAVWLLLVAVMRPQCAVESRNLCLISLSTLAARSPCLCCLMAHVGVGAVDAVQRALDGRK